MKLKQTIINIIKSRYYTYVPGEFLPVFEGDQLYNSREFHLYKAKRAARRIRYAIGYTIYMVALGIRYTIAAAQFIQASTKSKPAL